MFSQQKRPTTMHCRAAAIVRDRARKYVENKPRAQKCHLAEQVVALKSRASEDLTDDMQLSHLTVGLLPRLLFTCFRKGKVRSALVLPHEVWNQEATGAVSLRLSSTVCTILKKSASSRGAAIGAALPSIPSLLSFAQMCAPFDFDSVSKEQANAFRGTRYFRAAVPVLIDGAEQRDPLTLVCGFSGPYERLIHSCSGPESWAPGL